MAERNFIWAQRNGDHVMWHNTFVCFRTIIRLEEGSEVASAPLDIFADSRYQLFLNGQRIGLGPAPADPRHQSYDSYETAEYWRGGENVLAVVVLFLSQTGNNVEGRPELMVDGRIADKAGGERRVTTGSGWKWKLASGWLPQGPNRSIMRAPLEVYDRRKEEAGWLLPGFDDSGWYAPALLEEAIWRERGGTMSARDILHLSYREVEGVRIGEGRAAFADDSYNVLRYGLTSSLRETADGSSRYYTYDFAMEHAGRIGLLVRAPAGIVIDILNHESEPNGLELPFADNGQWRRYITAEGEQQWLTFAYEGLRYVQIVIHRADSGACELLRVWLEEQYYPAPQEGAFFCSDPLLNRVYEAGRHTVRVVMQDLIPDNVVREQAPWSGDGEYAKLPIYYATGDCRLAARTLRQVAFGQSNDGQMRCVWPSGLNLIFDQKNLLMPLLGTEIPQHSMQWILAIWRYYMHSGDRALVEELYPNAMRYRQWLHTHRDEDGLLYADPNWRSLWTWLDWEGLRTFWTATHFLYYGTLLHLRLMADLLGQTEDASELRAEMNAVREIIMKRYWFAEYEAFVDCFADGPIRAKRFVDVQYEVTLKRMEPRRPGEFPVFSEHTLGMAVMFGLVPPASLEAVIGRIASGLPSGSPVQKYLPYWALSIGGRHQAVLDELRSKWAVMESVLVTNTCQETFVIQPGSALCHAPAALPAYYLPAYVLGIMPSGPGFASFAFEPHPCDLTECRGTVPTPYGPIHAEWSVTDGKLEWRVDPPEGFRAGEFRETGGGVRATFVFAGRS